MDENRSTTSPLLRLTCPTCLSVTDGCLQLFSCRCSWRLVFAACPPSVRERPGVPQPADDAMRAALYGPDPEGGRESGRSGKGVRRRSSAALGFDKR